MNTLAYPGAVVQFWPAPAERGRFNTINSEPFAALVLATEPGSTVWLLVFDHKGQSHRECANHREDSPLGDSFWDWTSSRPNALTEMAT